MRLAYLSQELAELDPDQRVREAVEEIRLRIRVGDRELSAGQLLERLGFTTERQWTRVGDLSGGERRRVQMLRLLMGEPNVLLLDEPTNDLDIETLTEFEDLLDDWPGTLVVVSHDRYFLERVTEHVVALLGDGRLSFLGGGVDEYLDRVPGRPRYARGSPGRSRPGRSAAAVGGRGAHRPQGTAAPRASAGAALGPRDRARHPASRQRHRLRKAHPPRRRPESHPGREIRRRRTLADRSRRTRTLSEPKGSLPASQRAAGAAWTERAKGAAVPPGLRSDEGATREGGASRRPRRREERGARRRA